MKLRVESVKTFKHFQRPLYTKFGLFQLSGFPSYEMSLNFPNLPETLNPTKIAELKAKDPREYFRAWYTDVNSSYNKAPEWFYDACDWRKKPGASTHYVHPPRRARGKNGRYSSLDRTTFHPALAEYSNHNPPHILYLWDRQNNVVPKSWPLPPKLVDENGDVIMDTDPQSGKQIVRRFWAHAPEQISRSPDLCTYTTPFCIAKANFSQG